MPLEKVNLAQKFDGFQDYWSPKIAGEVNNFAVKLVKLKGEFIWHHHENEDELFLVVKGRLLINCAKAISGWMRENLSSFLKVLSICRLLPKKFMSCYSSQRQP